MYSRVFEGGFFSQILPWHVANQLYSLTAYIPINRSHSPVLDHHPFLANIEIVKGVPENTYFCVQGLITQVWRLQKSGYIITPTHDVECLSLWEQKTYDQSLRFNFGCELGCYVESRVYKLWMEGCLLQMHVMNKSFFVCKICMLCSYSYWSDFSYQHFHQLVKFILSSSGQVKGRLG